MVCSLLWHSPSSKLQTTTMAALAPQPAAVVVAAAAAAAAVIVPVDGDIAMDPKPAITAALTVIIPDDAVAQPSLDLHLSDSDDDDDDDAKTVVLSSSDTDTDDDVLEAGKAADYATCAKFIALMQRNQNLEDRNGRAHRRVMITYVTRPCTFCRSECKDRVCLQYKNSNAADEDKNWVCLWLSTETSQLKRKSPAYDSDAKTKPRRRGAAAAAAAAIVTDGESSSSSKPKESPTKKRKITAVVAVPTMTLEQKLAAGYVRCGDAGCTGFKGVSDTLCLLCADNCVRCKGCAAVHERTLKHMKACAAVAAAHKADLEACRELARLNMKMGTTFTTLFDARTAKRKHDTCARQEKRDQDKKRIAAAAAAQAAVDAANAASDAADAEEADAAGSQTEDDADADVTIL